MIIGLMEAGGIRGLDKKELEPTIWEDRTEFTTSKIMFIRSSQDHTRLRSALGSLAEEFLSFCGEKFPGCMSSKEFIA